MIQFPLTTRVREEFIDITSSVEEVVRQQKVVSGLCLIFCPHTTAALTINENADCAVRRDMLVYLKKLVPQSQAYTHGEGNSDAHIKSSLLGNSLQIIISEGILQLGAWQGIYFCEFDGPRSRTVWVGIIRNI